MKKLLLILLLCAFAPVFAGMAIAPGTAAHTHSDANTGGGTLAVSGTVSSTKACVTGFIRENPNYCRRSVAVSDVAWADATACTARTTGKSLPADATAVRLHITWSIKSNNAVALRANDIKFFNDTTCTAAGYYTALLVSGREFVAVIAGTDLYYIDTIVDVPLAAADTFYATQTNAGGSGTADVQYFNVLGYFD